ncbi:MAG: GTP-binding protein [Methylococcales symbiont of Iophon sp. n. MRB-2018]|nr:MAG: GTP-binding protein [Methylococcales symbiont of Iophon sp. n. MRB-2018]KAF3980408.1 MAG: GTP-binding protein [Methylococcales symbiont of Iophon sp. n. MRB-2018]
MAYDYSDIQAKIDHWVQHAIAEGWIEKTLTQTLVKQKNNSANDLFTTANARPLLVSFIGGTGVGKSSLLNKLAGQSIAKAGVERPTSREVTLYYHQSISLHLLEETFPVHQIKLAQHSEDANKHIIWMDMPDFDSTEQKNKDIVLQWLPFIDVLIYVVSPERYRDNKAWQMLLAEGANHAWVFVLNQWDKGVAAQYDDFKQQLALADFNDPLVFKTVCTEQIADEFSQLQSAIENIATEKTIDKLESRGLQQRKDEIKNNLEDCLKTLGGQQAFLLLADYQKSSWLQTQKVLKQGFEWPAQQAAKHYSEAKIDGSVEIWDAWAQSRFNDYLDDLIVTINQYGLPTTPIRKTLMDSRTNAKKILHIRAELGCRQSLVNPGNAIQRMLLKIATISEIMLPLIAMSVVGYEVLQGYYNSSTSNTAFLGANFAVHSGLLILISWLLPFSIRKKMQPSLEKAALKGLHNGLDEAMRMINNEVIQTLKNFKMQQNEKIAELNLIIMACDNDKHKMDLTDANQQLNRMLVD